MRKTAYYNCKKRLLEKLMMAKIRMFRNITFEALNLHHKVYLKENLNLNKKRQKIILEIKENAVKKGCVMLHY